MKNILLSFLLFSTVIFGQQNDKKWDKVIAYENEGKVKSAAELVNKIYKKAVDDKDEVQMIKCFFYHSKYLQVVDENAQTKILNNLKTDINRVSIPSQAILNLVYAKCLNDYYIQNFYSINSRTNTAQPDDDFTTWTSKNFRDQIASALKKTLGDESILKNTPLSNYEQIIDYSVQMDFKKETVFDFVLTESIGFYSKKISSTEIKQNEFNVYQKDLLADSETFTKLNFSFVTDENLRILLSLYQKQETGHPTIENQLERINFLNTNSIISKGDYFTALNNLQQKSKQDKPLTQKIQLEKAHLLLEIPSKETDKINNKMKSALLLDSILSVNNRSNAYKLALVEKQKLNLKSLSIEFQEKSYENENTRFSIRYINVDRLKVSIFKINQKTVKDFRNSPYNKDSLINTIRERQKAIASEDYSLLNRKDYNSYTTELLLPKLGLGSYLLCFESDSDIKNEKAFVYDFITVSNIAVLGSQDQAKENFLVVDRKTGKPLQDVTIKFLNHSIKTDQNGMASNTKSNGRNYISETVEFSTSKDTILNYQNYLSYNDNYKTDKDVKARAKIELFLDRAIYRPGQTVYYKGIAFQKKKNEAKIIGHSTFKIEIKNPQYEIYKEFTATTNEFGSFSGEFKLPQNGLTGTFTINIKNPNADKSAKTDSSKENDSVFWQQTNFERSEIQFKVEEYKRPKFEILFDALKKNYQMNQNVVVTGWAKAFAGSNISDAKVTYQVTLTPFTKENGTYYQRNGKTEPISNGETTTDATGKFEINFIAKPFENLTKDKLPIFSYKIKATITDINGETHEAYSTVKIGYHDLILGINLPRRIQTKNKNEILLTSTTLNGEPSTATGDIKIYYIKPFSDKFKTRVFQHPDIETISDPDFEKLFPYENNSKTKADKPDSTLVYSKKINTEKDKKILLEFMSNYKSGYYKVIYSAKDHFENTIETFYDFQVTQSKDKFNPGKLFTVEQINTDPKKDGFVQIKLVSVIPELYILTRGNYLNQIYFEEIVPLKNNETIIKVPLKKEFEKAININFQCVFENEVFDDQIEVHFKTEEPKLEFDVETFRNKIQPGSNENWSFKLKSIHTTSEAEVLASMYDSSLDKFTKADWKNLMFHEYNYNTANFKSGLGFDKKYNYLGNLNLPVNKVELSNELDYKLIWFGFDFNDSFTTYQQREYLKQLNKKTKKPLNANLISGVILDKSGLGIPGTSVTIKNTQRIAISDLDGYYEIEAAPEEELVFSNLGYKTQSIIANKNRTIDLVLFEDTSSLKEVVVTGYGSLKKKALTAAVVSIEEDNNVYNTAGVDVPLEVQKSKQNLKDIKIRGRSANGEDQNPLYVIDGKIASQGTFDDLNPSDIMDIAVVKDEKAMAIYGSKAKNGVIIITTKKALETLTQVKARKNLSETAFFYPNLRTDSKGNVSFSFTSPEALTAWKLRLLAHNKEAVSGYLEKSVVTQKELMVLPNFPRFFREKDTIVISAKISNVTDKAKSGIAILQFFDATTMQPIDAKMGNAKNVRNFTIGAFGNTTATWTISIPEGLQGVQYKILAKSGDFSDGEENILPVLTNNMLVTESIPIWVRENSTKEYTFENLKNNNSTTLKNHQFTLEYTSNPAWFAIQSLPYLMEYEHECAEQTFARFYANALASEIISSNPKIATVFEEWRKNGKLKSKLEENEELKSIILAETPWLNDAQSEDEKKKNLALLFDLEKMKTSQEATFEKLKQKQKTSGGFAWFDGSDENEYITRHILAGLGHLSKMNKKEDINAKIDQISKTGIPFLDNKFLEQYKSQTKSLKATDKLIWISPYSDLHYLYTRSFYLDQYPLSDTLKKATKLYLEIAKKNWLNYSLYEKGLAALTLNRFGESESAKKIIESLKETSSNNEDWGMYWIANKAGWYWYQAPIETQALLIEAFAEVNHDTKSVDAMKVWLLKNKQTKNWPTTKSTTEAIYALLMQGNDWLSVKDNTIIKIGNEKILTKKLVENEKEAETGYIKLNWKADEVKKDMASITVQNKSKVPGFGGLYWQYFEDLDKIKTNSAAVLSVSKELYLKKNSMKGDELQRITSKNPLKTGDLVTVRLIITSKEDTEYVHLKDMRASCFEPVNVLSEYQYKDRLGYYMSTKDAATHFFFDRINKGTYVLEYDIRVNNSGEFSNGITTIESMYAPEFASHTKGIRVKVQ